MHYYDPDDTCCSFSLFYPALQRDNILDDDCTAVETEYEDLLYSWWFYENWYEIRRNGFSWRIVFIQKFYDHGQFAGIFTLVYDIDVLDKMISPLYDDS